MSNKEGTRDVARGGYRQVDGEKAGSQDEVTQVVGHDIHFFFDDDGTVTITDLPDELADIPTKLEHGN